MVKVPSKFKDRKLFSMAEVAEILGVSIGYVHKLKDQSKIVCERVGKQWIIQRKDLQEFIDQWEPRQWL